MKFAFCLFRYYPFGGLERDCIRIANECLKRGHTVNIYTMSWEGAVTPGLSVTLIPTKGSANHTRCLAFVKQLNRHFLQTKYDLIVGFNRMPGLDVYYAADICYVASAQVNHGRWYRLTPRYRAFAALEKAVYSPTASTKILLLSGTEQDRIVQHYGTSSKRFYLLPPGIDRKKIIVDERVKIRNKVRAESGIRSEQYLLLMVGSDFKRKRVDRTLAAIAALPLSLRSKTKLWVVGKGKVAPMLQIAKQALIEQHVVFMGARDDVSSLMLAADALVHPAHMENTGTVILEALVAGLPVLATDNCGYAFHVREAAAGLVVPMPFQQQTLNQYLVKMLNQKLLEEWRVNARCYAENHDLYSLPQRAVSLFEKFYQEKKVNIIDAGGCCV